MKMWMVLAASFLFVAAATAGAQIPACVPVVPQTRLELLRAKPHVLIIAGQSDAITVRGNLTSLAVIPTEVCEVGTGERRFGLHIRLAADNNPELWDSFVDYHEIDAIVAGLEGMGHLPPGATRLAPSEAIVSTLTLVIRHDVRGNAIEVRNPAGAATFTREQSGELRKAFADAKVVLDRARL